MPLPRISYALRHAPRHALRHARWLLLVVAAAVACGSLDGNDGEQPEATLSLLSRAPLGLHYGERATLSLRYRRDSQPVPGATLSVHLDRDDSGATLSANRLITNDRGEASVLLTAGASEGAFHVVIDAPYAPSLVVDVAVSRFDFGSLDVLVDATAFEAAVLVRAGLVLDSSCAQLPATPMPLPAARQTQASERRATLPFPVLVLMPYSVYARAEDAQGRLLAYGCVDLPDSLLRTGLRPVVSVPLAAAMPSPIGSFDLTIDLVTRPPSPDPFAALACTSGQGQLLLDGLLEALAPVDGALTSRLLAVRAPLDASGCRSGTASSDERMQMMLSATSAGSQLQTIAADLSSVRSRSSLITQLDVTAGSLGQFQARHTLRSIRFAIGASSVHYSLSSLPVITASDLALSQTGSNLMVPPHVLTLGLPGWWARAFVDLVQQPRGILATPAQLFTSAVNAASASALVGCAAIESALCAQVSPPCAGKLVAACTSGRDSSASRLGQALSNSPPGYDLSLSMLLHVEDTSGSLQAQKIHSGQVSGIAGGASGATMLSGAASGPRL